MTDKRVVSCDYCRKQFQNEFQKEEHSNNKERATTSGLLFETIAKILNKNPFFELNEDELGLSVHWKGALKCG